MSIMDPFDPAPPIEAPPAPLPPPPHMQVALHAIARYVDDAAAALVARLATQGDANVPSREDVDRSALAADFAHPRARAATMVADAIRARAVALIAQVRANDPAYLAARLEHARARFCEALGPLMRLGDRQRLVAARASLVRIVAEIDDRLRELREERDRETGGVGRDLR